MPEQLLILEPPSELDRLSEKLQMALPSINSARADAWTFRKRLESKSQWADFRRHQYRRVRVTSAG